MKTDTDWLRELYQGYAESRFLADRKGCPSPEILAGTFISSTSRRRKKQIADHITQCSFCREEFMFIIKLQELAVKSNEHTREEDPTNARIEPVRGRIGAFVLKWQYACALLGMGLIAISLFMPTQLNQVSKSPRSNEMSLVLLYPTSSHNLSDKLIFRWEEKTENQYYVLELFDEDLILLWTSPDMHEPEVEVPPDIVLKMRSGGYYFWMVTAYSETGRRTESPLTMFLVHSRD